MLQIGFLVSSGIAFMMGLSDDAYNTKPLLKFGAQLLCGFVLIITGTYIELFPYEPLNYFLTVFWIIAIMNSINMLDNMDAITAIVSTFILLLMLVLAIIAQPISNFFVTTLVALSASLLVFLYFNWNPSKMFMGDTGSQFLGIILASFSIHFLWNYKEVDSDFASTKQILFIALAFIIPISDTATVTINRLARGQSPFIGGKDHTTHHLSYLGFSDRQIALLFAFISLISCSLILLIVFVFKEWNHFLSLIFAMYFIIVFLALYGTTRAKKARDKFNQQLKAKKL
jgi:UDP-GlcNAc:undecaprenyl-phosphate GlcNAc-1-phosphate transferase